MKTPLITERVALEYKATKFNPLQWYLISLANTMGYDKVTYDERIEKALTLLANPSSDKWQNAFDNADAKNEFLALVNAWDDIVEGNPVRVKVGLDATSSGCQLFAIVAGDETAAEMTNVIPTGKRRDMYTEIYAAILNECPEINSNIARADVKEAIMTALYGSEKVPLELFGSEYIHVFNGVLEKYMPNVVKLNNLFQSSWDSSKSIYEWRLPDNFYGHFKVMDTVQQEVTFLGKKLTVSYKKNAPVKRSKCLSANFAHTLDSLILREVVRRCNILPAKKSRIGLLLDGKNMAATDEDKRIADTHYLEACIKHFQETGFFSTRILDCINPLNVDVLDDTLVKVCKQELETIQENPYKVLTIHDCFYTHPNNVEYMRESVMRAYAELARSNVEERIIEEMIGIHVDLPKLMGLEKQIMKADYIIC